MSSALRVGLTGGVAAGKSTVGAAFARRGVPVFSADAVSHALTAPGAPLLADVRAAFGDTVFHRDGALDRTALAAQVFRDGKARSRLEAILHPMIRAVLREQAARTTAPYCVIEIPLLSADDVGTLVDRVLVVDAPEPEQRRRLRARNDLDEAGAQRVIDAQVGRTERLALADDVFTNDRAPAAIDRAVAKLDAFYRDIARAGDPRRPGIRLQ